MRHQLFLSRSPAWLGSSLVLDPHGASGSQAALPQQSVPVQVCWNLHVCHATLHTPHTGA